MGILVDAEGTPLTDRVQIKTVGPIKGIGVSAPGGEDGGVPTTWNVLDKSANITISDGDRKAENAGNAYSQVRGLGVKYTGKWYFELKATVHASTPSFNGYGVCASASGKANYLGAEATQWCYWYDGNKINNNANTSYGTQHATVNTVVGVIVDLDNSKIYFSNNGTIQNSGDPGLGTGFAFSNVTGPVVPACSFFFGGDDIYISADVVNCTYTPPSGFSYWSLVDQTAP